MFFPVEDGDSGGSVACVRCHRHKYTPPGVQEEFSVCYAVVLCMQIFYSHCYESPGVSCLWVNPLHSFFYDDDD